MSALRRTQEGDKRTSVELQVDEIGPSLRYVTANVARPTRATAVHSDHSDEPPF